MDIVHPNIDAFLHELQKTTDPILVASYGDISRAARTDRPILHMEHGTGHAFGTAPYPNGTKGKRDLVDLFLRRVEAGGTHSLDQLLNAVQITTTGGFQVDGSGRKLVEMLLRDLAKGR